MRKMKSLPSSKIFLVLDISVHDTAMYEQYRINVELFVKEYNDERILNRLPTVRLEYYTSNTPPGSEDHKNL